MFAVNLTSDPPGGKVKVTAKFPLTADELKGFIERQRYAGGAWNQILSGGTTTWG